MCACAMQNMKSLRNVRVAFALKIWGHLLGPHHSHGSYPPLLHTQRAEHANAALFSHRSVAVGQWNVTITHQGHPNQTRRIHSATHHSRLHLTGSRRHWIPLRCHACEHHLTQRSRFGSLLSQGKLHCHHLVKDNCKLFVLAQAGERSSVM